MQARVFVMSCEISIAHIHKERQTGTRVGARSIMGSFGGTVPRAKIFSLMH